MGRELSHCEAAGFLGAYALHALDDDERARVELHVSDCRACQVEVSEHREVVACLAPGSATAPDGLWDRIAASLEEAPPPLEMPVVPPAPVVPIERAHRRRTPLAIAAAVAAVAAVAVIGVLGLKVLDDERRIRDLASDTPARELDRTVRAAVADPTARRIELVSVDKQLRADTVVLPDGTGYLVSSNLPELRPARTYQLWALVGTSKISVGVLGTKPGATGFKAAPDASGFAITEEVAGGVVATEKSPVVVGRRP
jgi:hypothetical protein